MIDDLQNNLTDTICETNEEEVQKFNDFRDHVSPN